MTMRRPISPCVTLLLLGLISAEGQTISSHRPAPHTAAFTQSLPPEEVIRRFTTKESELREVWKEFAYVQETKVQVLGPANTISGEFYQLSEFVFDDRGKRIQRILKAPPSALEQAGILTYEDKHALTNLQPFSLTAEELPNYKVTYGGREKIDDLNTYVFDVTPKVMSDQRELKRLRDQKVEGKYFQGRVWVDDQDFQIVKSAGKVVPEFKQRFPKFETYRENVRERYWLPTYTYGDDVLEFEKGGELHVRLVVRYKDYRQFQGDVKLIFDDNAVIEETQKGEGKDKTSKPDEKKTDKKPTPPPSRP
jgi:hypothetical protein